AYRGGKGLRSREGLHPSSVVRLLSAGLRCGFAAGDFAKLWIIARCHAPDIALQVFVPLCGDPQGTFEDRAQQADREGEDRRIDGGGLASHEERLLLEISRDRINSSRRKRDDLGA